MRAPSNRYTPALSTAHTLVAATAMALNTGWISLGELEIRRRISLIAIRCSCASALSLRSSASCFSRSRTLASSALGDLRIAGDLASVAFAGFGPRPIGLPLPLIVERLRDRLGERAHLGKCAGRTRTPGELN